MNAVEIEQAITELAEQPFDAAEFPFAFLEAFGRKPTEIKRLRKGDANKSDLGGVLQRNNIHILTCAIGTVSDRLAALRDSPATARFKAKFILATDGEEFQAEDLAGDEMVVCDYQDFPNHFGVFLTLAGISTVKQIKDNTFDIRATSRLNRLYVELLKDNPDWGTAERRHDMNHFMARLIFCFFAEDTDIFDRDNLFTSTIDRMSNRDGSNTHEVIGEIFHAMNTEIPDRAAANLPRWANAFPYVNGGLFSGSTETPRFSKIAQRYLSHIGGLDWTQINPDIFGSMIQAVADEDERSALGMHYTSVPNILKVLNPLFLDDLREKLAAAQGSPKKLLNLRKRIANIRVFDPACGSGNFLVIAYKELRAIEAEINTRRGEPARKSDISIRNFRGIELRSFSAEIARLALIIAEYQCDVTYRGQKEALAEFLPLDAQNWITCGNALQLDWLSVCPPTGTGVKFQADDLFMSPLDQAQIDFANEGGETYICGNPPYLGGKGQTPEQKAELTSVFDTKGKIGELDYVSGWIIKAVKFINIQPCKAAFVTTNSLNQGAQVHQLWPVVYSKGVEINFAYKNIRWSNNAANNAAVICSILGLQQRSNLPKTLFENDLAQRVDSIGPYLIPNTEQVVMQSLTSISGLTPMLTGNSPYDGGNLFIDKAECEKLINAYPEAHRFIKKIYGSGDYISGEQRYCIWVSDSDAKEAAKIPELKERFDAVAAARLSGGQVAKTLSKHPHKFRYTHTAKKSVIIVPRVSSENRPYIPFGLLKSDTIVSDSAQAIYDAPIWHLAILLSQIHMAWVKVLAGRLKTDIRYSSAICYNTFPVPKLTEKNRADLTAAAEGILLAREAHFPATIADLYDPEKMPANLRAAHDHNDEVLERIYIGRRFRNDTERLEKLFEMYTKMTTKVAV